MTEEDLEITEGVKYQDFVNDLKELFYKWRLDFVNYDNYDGEGNYTGTDVYLKFGDQTWMGDTLHDVLAEAVWQIHDETKGQMYDQGN